MPDNLILAAKRARDLASTLTAPDAKTAFLELAAKWEAEAALMRRGDEAGSAPGKLRSPDAAKNTPFG
ncbi:MAG: hypothetical protein AB7S92_18200 [Parvibaculaceae bacterium]